MDIPEEAERRYSSWFSYNGPRREAFIAGAEWARKQTLEEAEAAVRPQLHLHLGDIQ